MDGPMTHHRPILYHSPFPPRLQAQILTKKRPSEHCPQRSFSFSFQMMAPAFGASTWPV